MREAGTCRVRARGAGCARARRVMRVREWSESESESESLWTNAPAVRLDRQIAPPKDFPPAPRRLPRRAPALALALAHALGTHLEDSSSLRAPVRPRRRVWLSSRACEESGEEEARGDGREVCTARLS